MEIRESSLAIKYYNFFYQHHLSAGAEINLCKLMRRIAAATLLGLIAAGVALFIFISMAASIYFTITTPELWNTGVKFSVKTVLIITGASIWGLIVFFGFVKAVVYIAVFSSYLRRRKFRAHRRKPCVHCEPGTIRLWLRAKKEKVCPAIKIVE
ncbi:MAG: hypothetical protein V1661_02655 [bacterium]